MDAAGRSGPRKILAALAIVAALGGAAAGLLAARQDRGPAIDVRGSLHCVEEGEYLYAYDARFGVESLRRVDPETGAAAPVDDPARLERLRALLLAERRVRSLEGIAPVPAGGDGEPAERHVVVDPVFSGRP